MAQSEIRPGAGRLRSPQDGLQSGLKTHRRRKFLDRFGRVMALSGGLIVFAAVITLIGFIGKEILPLLKPAEVTHTTSVSLADAGVPIGSADVLVTGLDEYQEKAFVLRTDGVLQVIDIGRGDSVDTIEALPLDGAQVTAARYRPRDGVITVGTDDGRVFALKVDFPVRFEGSVRHVGFAANAGEAIYLGTEGRALSNVALAETDEGVVVAGLAGPDARFVVVTREVESSFFGDAEMKEYRFDLSSTVQGRVTALAVEPDGRFVFVGTDRGLLHQWDVTNSPAPKLVATMIASGKDAGRLAQKGEEGDGAVRVMRFLIGGQSLVVGDGAGGVATWFQQPDEAVEAGRRFHRVHVHRSHNAPVTHIAVSQRNRSFLTSDATGVLQMHHSTSEQTFYAMDVEGGHVADLVIAPKSDGQMVLTGDRLHLWSIDNPHPEISLRTLFAPIHYEGYGESDLVWQSTGGSDEFESKFSLTPLAYGTIKGTIYALLFALPLGVLGAIYTSQFMNPKLQAVIKPIIEIMAGLPSVVLGFLAALWLAPLLAKIFPSLVVMGLLAPLLVILSAWLWRLIPAEIRRRLPKGWEGLWLVPVIVLGAVVSLQAGPALELTIMQGDFRFWLFDAFGLPYDVRNSLVIGIVMGFAVIPIVFSISEDALSSVPRDLVAGSLALGVTRWQTVLGVVVPAALPGILSSIMVGFGRAVGETMIVLMATGNTPVMDMNIFSGFRALSANIAVEMPEAPVGGTLYRVLFVAALLLFIFTFTLNTVGEMIRMRMRRRVSRL